jgi:hypothetical protein
MAKVPCLTARAWPSVAGSAALVGLRCRTAPLAGPHTAPPKLSRAAYQTPSVQVPATGPRAVIPSCFLLGRLIEIRSKERERRVNERDESKTDVLK